MTRDFEKFPEDDNGNLLWQMHEDGDDLDEIHELEFSMYFKTQELAEKCAISLLLEEQKISLYLDEEVHPNEWVITIYVNLFPEYEDIVDLEQWFTKIAEQFDGEYDGWGCTTYVFDMEEGDEQQLN
ncbi:ribonuclease E inhibitor RraB [Acinetobacter bereziniae]|uniref:Ribonuclease E inhibitor RraB n=1 Tax=Acinetobacter bereziniae TaxID=106648 RepID=A0A8I1AK37_ACIBZ|nr:MULTISPECIES: ribonuclease E inhibitor RraB [Acinetobacter]MEC8123520.1 ribonuclease E inhibitor RraB [Pseudomonadota bacterium]MBJ8420872.1 ribonuclease E inhibitor RraB [Acinetobacter bereziniae]MBJ9948487.1 ribonuclease E inhibitor RraB [Acinetobacter bereziniae]MCU4474581.1 ribonuclease E inhibitor RraB [Acinetobacter bereziniae]MCU4541796.1 ribonuclease E inhibitor RraB [Acinetobacter bereziniae]